MRFALTQMKAVLSTLVKHFELSLKSDSNAPSGLDGMIFFSDNDCQITIKRLR